MPDENPQEGSEAEARKLIAELESRARFYFKDLSNTISAIVAPLSIIISRGRSEDKADIIRKCMGTITRCYDSIPFDKITEHLDYDIFAIMDKGEEYRERLKAIYKKIRSIHGFENYEFKMTSPITGEEWSSSCGL